MILMFAISKEDIPRLCWDNHCIVASQLVAQLARIFPVPLDLEWLRVLAVPHSYLGLSESRRNPRAAGTAISLRWRWK